MLDAYRQAYVAIRNTARELLLFGELRVRCRRRVNGEAARVADVGDMIVKLQRVDELAACVLAAGQLKADQPAELALEVPVGAFAMDALLLRRMNDPLDLLSRAQEIDHRLSVLAVLMHTQCKRLQSLDDEEGVER